MKKQLVATLAILFSLLLFSCGSSNSPKESKVSETSKSNMVEVIDFYGTHRCVTCEAIEANSRYTVETFFAEELKSGKIVFKVVNVDEEANYDMAEEFETTSTALFLNVIKDGKARQVNLTEFAFAKGKEKEVFSKELAQKIKAELEKI